MASHVSFPETYNATHVHNSGHMWCTAMWVNLRRDVEGEGGNGDNVEKDGKGENLAKLVLFSLQATILFTCHKMLRTQRGTGNI